MSFPVIHKVSHVCNFVLLKFKNKLDKEINDFNFNSKHYTKMLICRETHWALNCFQFISIRRCTKCQHCQLCVLVGKLEQLVLDSRFCKNQLVNFTFFLILTVEV